MEQKKNIIEFIKPRERQVIENDYLSSLAANAILLAEKQQSKSKRRIIKRMLFWTSTAAAVVFIFFQIDNSNQPVKCDFNSISTSEMYAYIDENIDDFDENLIVKYLKIDYTDTTKKSNSTAPLEMKSNIPTEKINTELKSDPFENIDVQDILKYLENEGITEEELEESVNG